MSKGSLIILLAFLITFLPFTGFPTGIKTILAILFGLATMALGYLVREERRALLRMLGQGHANAQKGTQEV